LNPSLIALEVHNAIQLLVTSPAMAHGETADAISSASPQLRSHQALFRTVLGDLVEGGNGLEPQRRCRWSESFEPHAMRSPRIRSSFRPASTERRPSSSQPCIPKTRLDSPA